MNRVLFLIMIVAIAALPSFARGGNEAAPAPDVEGPAESVSAESDSGDEPAEAAGAPVDPTAMDPQTAEVLYGLGVLPFQNRIPSENFVLKDLDGADIALKDYRGKVVFLNFWATWCGPCRDEMPSMQVLYETLADQGLEIVAVNVLEPADTAAGFVNEFGFTYPVLLDSDGRISLSYGVRAFPTTYILDRDGNVIGLRQGTLDWGTPDAIAGFQELLAR
jgi:thiol-disulfide isomerase/thioredoxin